MGSLARRFRRDRVEAPDETSALKAAIEEFGIVNPERLFVRRVPGDVDPAV